MAINSTLANQIFFASQGVPATGKENSAGQAYTDAIAYAHAATYNPLEVLGGNTQEFVVKIYKTVLGRTNPLQDDPTGVVFWKNAIDSGTLSKAAFIDQMTAVAIKNGGSDKAAAEAANAAYVNEIYSNILGRPASQDLAGSQYWIDALNKGTIARSQVVDAINTAAAVNKDAGFQTKNTEYVTNLYKNLLGRDPEAEGLKYWTDALNAGTSKAELVVSLINSANSGTGADKANLAAKTEALNSFSANFTDYNILPGEGEYNNIRGEAGTKINGVNASTTNPAGEITNFLNNGYKDQHQEGQPTPAGTTVYATWNGALRAEWADATNTSDAEVTFKADTEEEKGLIRQAEKLGVDVSANTKNVTFKNLNGATEALTEVHINSNPASQATVNVDALAQLAAKNLTLIDRDGSTTIAWNSKVSNLKTIDLGNGDDNLIISNANNISNGITIEGGAGNDTLTLGTGNFTGKFASISGIEKIVTASQEAPTLDLKSVASYTGTADNEITEAGKALTVDNTLKLAISSSATTATKVNAQGNPETPAAIVSGDIIAATIANFDGTGKVILETETAKADKLQKVTGSKALANDVLNLGTEKTFDVLGSGTGNYIEDIDLVAANKVTLKYAQAIEKGFTLAGDVDGLTSGSLILNDTSSSKIDASKLKAVAGSTLEISGAANVKDIIGSTDANLSETVKLGSTTYSALESLKDLSLVESEGAKLQKIDAVNAGFNLKGDLKASLVSGDTSVDLTKMTAVLKADGNKSTIEVTAGLTTATKSNADLTKVIGSTDANLKDTLVLEGAQFGTKNSGDYTALAQIKDIDVVKVTNSNAYTSGAGILNSATTDGFELEGTLKVNVQAGDAAIDLSKITATKNGQHIDINAADAKGDVITIVGSNSANIVDRLQASGDFSRLESIDQVNTVHLGSGGDITANALKTIANAVDVTISGSANALTSIQATGDVKLANLANGHNALTSIAGKTVELGSGDFTTLTSLTGNVKAATGAKLSYDKLADQITTTGLVLDGSATNKLEISDATTAGVSTDLSKVTSVGGTSGAITITNVDENITLSGKTQNIEETVKLGKFALNISNVGTKDVLDFSGLKDLFAVQTSAKFSEVTAGSSGGVKTISASTDVYFKVTNDLYTGKLNDALVVENLLDNSFINGESTAGKASTLALRDVNENKTYIYSIVTNDTNAKIGASELKLIAVADSITDLTANSTNNTIAFA